MSALDSVNRQAPSYNADGEGSAHAWVQVAPGTRANSTTHPHRNFLKYMFGIDVHWCTMHILFSGSTISQTKWPKVGVASLHMSLQLSVMLKTPRRLGADVTTDPDRQAVTVRTWKPCGALTQWARCFWERASRSLNARGRDHSMSTRCCCMFIVNLQYDLHKNVNMLDTDMEYQQRSMFGSQTATTNSNEANNRAHSADAP